MRTTHTSTLLRFIPIIVDVVLDTASNSTFFDTVGRLGCTVVRCITSPVNTGSIAFHTQMGFQIEHVTGEHQDVTCAVNYELNGQHRVLFVKRLS